ncbi:nuclear transport factor 2 family protein [Flavobacterium sp. RSB2_4_14]|uniref:nuclear transport factor 2 family protein n=1 Tax=Flavobacterium sp. RSB2_4_14 TaxID=3447665 RepID=UPI003F362561
MKKLFLVALCIPFFIGCKKEAPAEPVAETPAAETTEQPAEFADAKYTELGKKAIAAMTAGDMDGWTANFSDNAKYYWNGGDSLVGKPAIDKYWRDRRANVIESIAFSNDIWLPVKVNKPQRNESNGVWLLGWYDVTASYKKGKEMSQSMHILYHFDENDKIDQVYHYVDRVPIMAAMPK